MNDEKLKLVCAKVLKLHVDQINDETSIHNVQHWDSLTTMYLVSELEEAFHIRFSIPQIMQITSFKAIRGIFNELHS